MAWTLFQNLLSIVDTGLPHLLSVAAVKVKEIVPAFKIERRRHQVPIVHVRMRLKESDEVFSSLVLYWQGLLADKVFSQWGEEHNVEDDVALVSDAKLLASLDGCRAFEGVHNIAIHVPLALEHGGREGSRIRRGGTYGFGNLHKGIPEFVNLHCPVGFGPQFCDSERDETLVAVFVIFAQQIMQQFFEGILSEGSVLASHLVDFGFVD